MRPKPLVSQFPHSFSNPWDWEARQGHSLWASAGQRGVSEGLALDLRLGLLRVGGDRLGVNRGVATARQRLASKTSGGQCSLGDAPVQGWVFGLTPWKLDFVSTFGRTSFPGYTHSKETSSQVKPTVTLGQDTLDGESCTSCPPRDHCLSAGMPVSEPSSRGLVGSSLGSWAPFS